MIDPQILRDEPEKVRHNLTRRRSTVDLDELLRLDGQWRSLNAELDRLRHRRKEIARRAASDPQLREEAASLRSTIASREEELGRVAARRQELLDRLPNFLAPDVPDGAGEEDNVEIRRWGRVPLFSFKARQHFELGADLGILDLAKGSRVAGSGFYYWKGDGAKLLWALFHFAWDFLLKKGFTAFFTPVCAKPRTLYGTGYLPFFEDEIYKLEGTDLCLIGTSEQTLVGYHEGDMLREEDLPLLYTAFTPCFRTEAGAHGKETRGIFRVHQFHKIEQIVFCKPEESPRWHEFCQQNEEDMLKALGIPYRVVNVCTGDLGAPGWKKYDCEAYCAGYGGFREVTSNTNLTDYQSRRLKIRCKGKSGRFFPHTISATGVTDRVAIAILEDFQQPDGSAVVPEVLRPYMGGQERIG